MICVEQWRARIGTFCGGGRSLGPVIRSVDHATRHVKQVTVSNVLLCYASLCFLTVILRCGVLVTETAFTAPFVLQNVSAEDGVAFSGSGTLLFTGNISVHAVFQEGDLHSQLRHSFMDNSTLVKQIINSTYFSFLVLLSGDVQINPGPSDQEHVDKPTNAMSSNLEERIDSKFSMLDTKISEVLATMQILAQTTTEQTNRLKRIEENFKRIEEEQSAMKESLVLVNKDIADIKQEISNNQINIKERQDTMHDAMLDLQDEVDRLESFSRRNNIKLFGVADTGQGPNEECENKVKDLLKKYLPEENWSDDVIERAHRLGHANSRGSTPRPIIAKFQRWGDLMKVMKNREARADMLDNGIRVSQDLTKRQSARLRELRMEGKIGFYVNGKLRIKDHRQDSSERRLHEGNPPITNTTPAVRGSPVDRQPINEAEKEDTIAAVREFSRAPLPADVTPQLDARPRTRSTASERQSSLREAWGTSTRDATRDRARTNRRK